MESDFGERRVELEALCAKVLPLNCLNNGNKTLSQKATRHRATTCGQTHRCDRTLCHGKKISENT